MTDLHQPSTLSELHASVHGDEAAIPGASQSSTQDKGLSAKTQSADCKSDDATDTGGAQGMTPCPTSWTGSKLTEPDHDPVGTKPVSTGGWAQYREQMNRLTAAVERAVSVQEREAESMSQGNTAPVDAQAILFSFEDTQTYRIPRDACRTWQVCLHSPAHHTFPLADTCSARKHFFGNGLVKMRVL